MKKTTKQAQIHVQCECGYNEADGYMLRSTSHAEMLAMGFKLRKRITGNWYFKLSLIDCKGEGHDE